MKRRILNAVQFALGAMVLWQAQALAVCPAPDSTPCPSGCTFADGQPTYASECSTTNEGCCQYSVAYYPCTTSGGATCSGNYVARTLVGGPYSNLVCRNGKCVAP